MFNIVFYQKIQYHLTKYLMQYHKVSNDTLSIKKIHTLMFDSNTVSYVTLWFILMIFNEFHKL